MSPELALKKQLAEVTAELEVEKAHSGRGDAAESKGELAAERMVVEPLMKDEGSVEALRAALAAEHEKAMAAALAAKHAQHEEAMEAARAELEGVRARLAQVEAAGASSSPKKKRWF